VRRQAKLAAALRASCHPSVRLKAQASLRKEFAVLETIFKMARCPRLRFAGFAANYPYGSAPKGDADEGVPQGYLPDEVVSTAPWEVDFS
jgi:hypothetical protein